MSSTSLQIDNWTDRVKNAMTGFNRKDKGRILRSATRPIVQAARGTSAFKDRTGTLRRSLDRVPGFRRSQSEFIGPRRGKRARSNADGFYAGAVFSHLPEGRGRGNGGKVFRQKVLVPAYNAGKRAAESIIINQSRKAIIARGNKNNVT